MPVGFNVPQSSVLNPSFQGFNLPPSQFGGGGGGGGVFPTLQKLGGVAGFLANPAVGFGLSALGQIGGAIFGGGAGRRRRKFGEKQLQDSQNTFDEGLNQEFDPSLREEFVNRGVSFLRENLRFANNQAFQRAAKNSGVRSGIAGGIAAARTERALPRLALPILQQGQQFAQNEFFDRRRMLSNRAGQQFNLGGQALLS